MGRSTGTVRAGVTAGLIGYAAVAVFYAILDVLAARGSLFTLDLLGKAVFRGIRDPAVLQLPSVPDIGAMVGYNFLHLGVALVVGLFVAWVVSRAEVGSNAFALGMAVVLAGFIATIMLIGTVGQDLLPLLPWWTIAVANTLAAVLAGVYLWRVRPGLRTRAVSEMQTA